MKNKIEDMEFTLRSEIPADCKAAWGARAIQNRGMDTLDILPDRQDIFAVDDAHRLALKAALDNGVFRHAITTGYEEALFRGELVHNKAGVSTLYEDGTIVVKGDTRGSCGYVYLCAYLKPSADLSKAVKYGDEGYNESPIKWSNEKDIPKIGDRITLKPLDLGTSRVVRHEVFHGYVALWVMPENPPPQYRQSHKLGDVGYKPCVVYGAEI